MTRTPETIYQSETPGGATYIVTAREYCSRLLLEIEAPGKLQPTYTLGKIEDGKLHFQGGAIQLRAEDVTPLTEAIAATVAEYAADPRAVETALREQREMLVTAISSAEIEITERKERAWGAGDERRGITDDPDWQAELGRRRAELETFDETHPEIQQAVAQERALRAAENSWR